MSQINRPPVGLQSLLGSQNFGDNPSDLAQQVLPQIDLFPFWAQQSLELAYETATSAGNGSIIELRVPDGKIWGMLGADFGEDMIVANDDCKNAIAVDKGSGGVDFAVVASINENVQALNGFTYCVWNPPMIFWLPSGSLVRGISNSSNASSRDFSMGAIYYELDV